MSDINKKYLNDPNFHRILNSLMNIELTVVAVSGYFDPLHVGHIEYLERAKSVGDKLVVIVINDNHYSFNEIKKNIIGVNINIREIKEFDKKLILKDEHPSRILICGSMQLVGKAISIF